MFLIETKVNLVFIHRLFLFQMIDEQRSDFASTIKDEYVWRNINVAICNNEIFICLPFMLGKQ